MGTARATGYPGVSCNNQHVGWFSGKKWVQVELPEIARRFIGGFDCNQNVGPFTFELQLRKGWG